MDFIWDYDSPIGKLTIASDGKSLIGVWIEGQRYFGAGLSDNPVEEEISVIQQAEKWFDIYFSGRTPGFTPPLNPRGSEFRKEVWKILEAIPYGETVTYGDISGILAAKRGIARMSAQAVGGAVGHNPLGIIIPCHRVVGSDGSLTGYAGGIEAKRYLLGLEKQEINRKGRNPGASSSSLSF